MSPVGQHPARQCRARRRRLSDEQTARRVLDAALTMLAEQGVVVGLDQLRFEDVIRAADVSRSSAYRRWPSRDLFVEDVLVELARGSDQPDGGAPVAAQAAELVADRAAELASADGRRDLFVELLRLTFRTDLEAMATSPQFRTYLALRAAFDGIASPDLRDQVAEAFAASERRAVARGAAILAGSAALFGRRLVPPLDGLEGFAAVSRSMSATSIGFIIAALADPALMTATREMAAYGSARPAAWSLPAFALAGIVLAHTEPDPQAEIPPPDKLAAGLVALLDEGAAAAASAR